MLESLPIVALTAEIGATIREEAMKAGATYFLNKPAKGQVFVQECIIFYVNFKYRYTFDIILILSRDFLSADYPHHCHYHASQLAVL
jgi:hypothetical protein